MRGKGWTINVTDTVSNTNNAKRKGRVKESMTTKNMIKDAKIKSTL